MKKNKTKSWFFEKLIKLLLSRKNLENTITNIRMKKGKTLQIFQTLQRGYIMNMI